MASMRPPRPDPVAALARSGLMALTGWPDGVPRSCRRWDYPPGWRRLTNEIETAYPGPRPAGPGGAGRRLSRAGPPCWACSRQGRTAPNGSCRLLRHQRWLGGPQPASAGRRRVVAGLDRGPGDRPVAERCHGGGPDLDERVRGSGPATRAGGLAPERYPATATTLALGAALAPSDGATHPFMAGRGPVLAVGGAGGRAHPFGGRRPGDKGRE